MATPAVAVASQSPTNTALGPSSPDRHSKGTPEIPPPLSLTVDAPAPSSPFPSPSSSFVPPPMPGAHEFANKPPSGRFVRRKKSGEPASPATKKIDVPARDVSREPNGTMPIVDTDMRSMGSGTVATPLTPTPASLAMTPTSKSPPEAIPAASNQTLDAGRSTPTQTHITLPSPPASPSPISNSFTLMRTPSGSGTTSKHTSLSSSRPAPASPSPAPSRRQSGAPSLRSRHRSGLSTASTSSKYGTIKSPPLPQPAKRKGEIKIRDFAFPGIDTRHQGRGPDAPKVIKRLLKHHGPLSEMGSRRASGMSESSVDSDEGGSRRSSGFGGWGAFRWASKIGGGWGFGSGSGSGSGSGGASRASGGGGGFIPSQQDFERNFDDGADIDPSDSADASEGEYLSDYENEEEGEGEGESEELLPGLYRALYDFDPEGTAEMGLKEGQMVKVVGRGGGVGWAIAVRADGVGAEDAGGEGSWALVPESYLRLVRLDEADQEGEEAES